MAERYLGYGYTNAQGIAKLEYDSEGNALTHSYTGVGAGKINIIAKSNGIESNECIIEDCLYLDDASSDNTSKYTINSTNATLTHSNGMYTLDIIVTTSAGYVDLRSSNNSSVLNLIKGKTITFAVDTVLNGNSVRLEASVSGTRVKTSEYTTTDGTLIIEDIEYPSNASSFQFRIVCENQGLKTISFKNFRIYVG